MIKYFPTFHDQIFSYLAWRPCILRTMSPWVHCLFDILVKMFSSTMTSLLQSSFMMKRWTMVLRTVMWRLESWVCSSGVNDDRVLPAHVCVPWNVRLNLDLFHVLKVLILICNSLKYFRLTISCRSSFKVSLMKRMSLKNSSMLKLLMTPLSQLELILWEYWYWDTRTDVGFCSRITDLDSSAEKSTVAWMIRTVMTIPRH